MTTSKLIYLVTEGRYFLSHRMPMVRAAQAEGFDVAVITNAPDCRAAIEAQGIRVIPLSLDRRNLSPLTAIKHVSQLVGIYRREKPAVVHHIAMKPVLYGSLAAWLAGTPRVINAFAGLGYVFTSQEGLATALRPFLLLAFRFLLKRPQAWLLLQNDDDRRLLQANGLTPAGRTLIIRGSGIDLDAFPQQPPPPADGDFIVAFAGRMIGIKGLQTLKEAFALLAPRRPRLKLWLCGTPDAGNPGSWTDAQMRQWEAEAPNVVYKGHCDMARIWAQAHAAVQPSWGGEGIPKSLLEAAACGRAIVATDVPGCREVVQDGRNGLLVPPRDVAALAQALDRLAGGDWEAMGRASRMMLEVSDLTTSSVTKSTAELYRRPYKAR